MTINKNKNELSFAFGGYVFKKDKEFIVYKSAYGKSFRVRKSDIDSVSLDTAGMGKSKLKVHGKGSLLAEVSLPTAWAEKAQDFILHKTLYSSHEESEEEVEEETVSNKEWYKSPFWIVIFIVMFFPLGLFLMWKYSDWKKEVKWAVTAIALFIFLTRFFGSSTPAKNNQSLESSTPSVISKEPKDTTEFIAPAYKVVYELNNIRYDGGKTYYLLIDPVDVSSDQYKDIVKAIVKDIAAQKGNKISIEIYDDMNTLDLYYKRYGDLSLGRPLTEEEIKREGKHQIASYDGDLETGLYTNTLSFFPSIYKDDPVFGKLSTSTEFSPSK